MDVTVSNPVVYSVATSAGTVPAVETYIASNLIVLDPVTS